MYRPSLKSGFSLIILFLLSVILYIVAQSSYVEIQTDHYQEKVRAANIMNNYLKAIHTTLAEKHFQFDDLDDPLKTGLIGTKLSSITTSKGLLSEKQTALNPNMAAAFVDLLCKADVKSGDYIAVGITGSNPGANLALYAAMTALGVKPSIITTLSSSTYGANREELTWLDVETILRGKGLIRFSSAYASLGGKDDLGIGLSDSGIQALREAMRRNGVPFLSGSSLKENIELRFIAYEEMIPKDKKYRLFVNIGGGLANVGSEVNAKLIPEKINYRLADKEFENPGVAMTFAQKNVPVLHIRRIIRLANEYYLPIAPDKMQMPGKGKVFSSRIHNIWVTSICLLLLIIAIIAVIIFDRHDRHFMANIVDPDEEL